MQQIPVDALATIIKDLPDPNTSKCDLWKAEIMRPLRSFDSPSWGDITYDVITFNKVRNGHDYAWVLLV